MIGGYGGSGLSNVELISIQSDNLLCGPADLHYASKYHSIATSDRGLITCGGYDGSRYNVYRLNSSVYFII